MICVIGLVSQYKFLWHESLMKGSGCGAVGRAVASNTRDPQFESSHGKFIYYQLYKKMHWKDENKEKRMAKFLK